MKERLIQDFLNQIQQRFDSTDLDQIRCALLIAMEKYEVTSASRELVITENTDIQHLKMFIVSKKVEGCTDKTLRYYKNEIQKFLGAVGKPVKEVDANDIRLFIAKKAMVDKVSATTQDNTLRILRSFFAWLTAEDYISKNPTAKIKRIRTEKKVKKPFSEIEVEKLRAGARDKRERAMIDILMSTGMRIGELYLLNRSDVEGDQLVVYGKGKKERYVYLNAKAQVSLAEYLDMREDDNEALFVTQDQPHERLGLSSFGARLRELGRDLGVKNVHPHRFRRTAATMALNRGMPIEQVQQMLGHEKIETTLIYAQAAQENVKSSHRKFVT